MESAPSHPAYDLLALAHPQDVASNIFTDKVLRKPLNLRPTSPDPNSQDARSARRRQRLLKKGHARKRGKPKRLSAKEKRALGIYDIPRVGQRYEIFVPLHRLWVGYMQDILGIMLGERNHVTAASGGSILASADFHGARFEVVRSRCVGRVGCKGIVVKDTKFTFEIVTKENVIKVVPKEHTIFRFEIPQVEISQHDMANKTEAETVPGLPNLVFELHGSQFENRAPDRATKKFKQRRMDDL